VHNTSIIRPTVKAKKISVDLKKSMQGILLDNWNGKFLDRLKPFVDKKRSFTELVK